MLPPLESSYKGEKADYDALTDLVSACCVCLSRRTMEMIIAFSRPMHWSSRYFSPTGAEIDAHLVDEWASTLEAEIVAGLNNCCGEGLGIPILTRITAEGVVEISLDGGLTWTPAPGADPRITSMHYPPLPGEDSATKACQAASNLVTYVEDFIDQLADILDAAGNAVTFIGGAVALWLTGGALAGLLVPLAGSMVSLGGSALRAAFDSGTWDDLRCAALCSFGEDGALDDTEFTDLLSRIGDDIGGLAGTVLTGIFQLMGATGLNNIASSGSSTGEDCGDCDPCSDVPDLVWDWHFGDPPTGATIEYVSDDIWTLTSVTRPGIDYAGGFKDAFDRCVGITEVISGGVALFQYNTNCAGSEYDQVGTVVGSEGKAFQWTSNSGNFVITFRAVLI